MSTKRNTPNQTTEKNAPCHARKEKNTYSWLGKGHFQPFIIMCLFIMELREIERKKTFLTSLVGANRSMFGHCAKNIFFFVAFKNV